MTNSVRRLALASPPYFIGPRSAAFDYPIRITAMTERGLVEGGIWPRTEDAYVAQLLQLLQAVEQEAPTEQRGPVRKALSHLTADGRAVATSVAAALINGGQIGG